jgi:hypothetical protein
VINVVFMSAPYEFRAGLCGKTTYAVAAVSARRHAKVAAIALSAALAATCVFRFVTFDPSAWADDVADQMSPFSRRTLGALSAIARASGPDDVGVALDGVHGEDFDARGDRYATTMKAMRARFHAGPGDCARYSTPEQPTPAALDEAVEAIVTAGLARQLDGLVADSLRWRVEEDDRLHAADAPAEAFEWFSERAPAWQRFGIWMHRSAARDALRSLRIAPVARHVKDDSVAAARDLSARYGPILTLAAMKVHSRMRNVDLRVMRISFVAPGMSERDVETRLGAPDDRQAWTWTWKDPATEVFFDERHEVGAVARTVAKDELISAGEKTLLRSDEAKLVDVLGPPAWSRDDDEGNHEVVWEAGPLRRRVVFEAGTLTRVELWKSELLTK